MTGDKEPFCRSWVTSIVLADRRLPVNFRYAPFATEIARRFNMSRRPLADAFHLNRSPRLQSSTMLSEIPARVMLLFFD